MSLRAQTILKLDAQNCLKLACCALACALFLVACQREQRSFRDSPPAARLDSIAQSPILPGTPNLVPVKNTYEENAYAVSQGQQLYEQYNCVGCHFHGGGGIGPPLMDDKWVYGSEPQNVFQTIVEGRPNGMPSFRGKIPDTQVWQIVAYVRSMSGQLSSLVAPGREDHMNAKKPEQSKGREDPKSSTLPGPAPPQTGGQKQ
ncbi:MAG TPA: cytochrome c [Pyrinomonadaceae bacterium]|jgi:cytochrome c oxidase cbb3-type subunit 3|nr:cytochrome c [Pyrinomonadaceae bacterium]